VLRSGSQEKLFLKSPEGIKFKEQIGPAIAEVSADLENRHLESVSNKIKDLSLLKIVHIALEYVSHTVRPLVSEEIFKSAVDRIVPSIRESLPVDLQGENEEFVRGLAVLVLLNPQITE